MKKPGNANINIPNALSLVRLLVIVPMFVFVMRDEMLLAAAMLFISGVSDCLDGFIARRFNQVTDLGKMLDPLADKLTQGALAVCIAIRFPVLFGILAIFVVKELAMLVGACVLFKKKKMPGAARWYGKLATVLFYITTGTIVVMQAFLQVSEGPVFYTVAVALLALTAVSSLYALYRYFLLALGKLHSNAPEDQFDLKKMMQNKSGEDSAVQAKEQ